MTNKEIKFELGKIALEKCQFSEVDDFTASLAAVYKWIIEEPTEEVIPEKPRNDYELKSVYEVYYEIQRIEQAEKAKWNKAQAKGHAARFMNVVRMHEIATVGQLIEYGKADFIRLRNMGRACADYVSMALKNLYGIDKW